MREIERDLHKIQGVESEYTYLQLSLTEKTRQAQEYSVRLRFEDANSKENMLAREKELLKMKDNYEQAMNALVDKRAALERLLKEQRDTAAQTQIDISRMQNQV